MEKGEGSSKGKTREPKPITTVNLRQDRPQGFEAARAKKRGLYSCNWGCESFFESSKAALEHQCEYRKNIYAQFVADYEAAGREAPKVYIDEANGNYSNSIGSSKSSVASNEGSSHWDKEVMRKMLGRTVHGKDYLLAKFLEEIKPEE